MSHRELPRVAWVNQLPTSASTSLSAYPAKQPAPSAASSTVDLSLTIDAGRTASSLNSPRGPAISGSTHVGLANARGTTAWPTPTVSSTSVPDNVLYTTSGVSYIAFDDWRSRLEAMQPPAPALTRPHAVDKVLAPSETTPATQGGGVEAVMPAEDPAAAVYPVGYRRLERAVCQGPTRVLTRSSARNEAALAAVRAMASC